MIEVDRRTAFVNVDFQNDFCPGGALAVVNGDTIAAALNRANDLGRKKGALLVATRDWHPQVTKHFKDYGGIWPVHCVQETKGAEFHATLNKSGLVVVSKGTDPNADGFSGFEGKTDNGKPLADLLRENNIRQVVVGGLATDYCVKATALDAVAEGFKTIGLYDGMRAVNLEKGDEERAIHEMQAKGVIFAASTDLK